jgi:N-acetylneuraminate synthase
MKKSRKVLIIAEAGVNHNGDEQLAMSLVDAAVKAGADIVKFQTFKADKLATPSAKQAQYQTLNIGKDESQYQMLSRLELCFAAHKRLQQYCLSQNIAYLSTAFDFESLSFLVTELGLTTLKIPSGELTNAPFVLAHARTGAQLIVSTGMADMTEVEQALGVIALGLLQSQGELLSLLPETSTFTQAMSMASGQKLLREHVTLLHCTTEYPANPVEVNLNAMDSLSQVFGLEVGYSDHTAGIEIPIAAVAKGAVLIEKHFTLDRNLPGPDHKASLEPDELTAMIKGIRLIELALGDGIKKPSAVEKSNAAIARKSLVASGDIKKGQTLSEDNVEIMRPGDGMSPYLYWSLLGKPASKNYTQGELLSE